MIRVSSITVFLFLIIGLWSCGGGDSGNSNINSIGGGWVTIDEPTTVLTYTSSCNSIHLGGEAFISPTWSKCCSGSADDTGVTVTWNNVTTGVSGNAFQSIDICYFYFYYPYLCHHRWSATVPLILGDNLITITASDPSGIKGWESITVTKPAHSFYVSGKVTNTGSIGLWGYGLSGFKLTLTGTASTESVFTDKNGYYSFSCVQNGSYTITPSSSINYTFTPPSRIVTVNNADIIGQDFVTDAYFISGTVTYSSGTGFSGVEMRLTDTNSSATYYTDANGSYNFTVPNDTYTITPYNVLGYIFSPVNRTLTVNNADLTGQDFQIQ